MSYLSFDSGHSNTVVEKATNSLASEEQHQQQETLGSMLEKIDHKPNIVLPQPIQQNFDNPRSNQPFLEAEKAMPEKTFPEKPMQIMAEKSDPLVEKNLQEQVLPKPPAGQDLTVEKETSIETSPKAESQEKPIIDVPMFSDEELGEYHTGRDRVLKLKDGTNTYVHVRVPKTASAMMSR